MIKLIHYKCLLNGQGMFIRLTLVFIMMISLTGCPSNQDSAPSAISISGDSGGEFEEELLKSAEIKKVKSSFLDLRLAVDEALMNMELAFYRLSMFEHTYHGKTLTLARAIQPCLENIEKSCFLTYKEAIKEIRTIFDPREVYTDYDCFSETTSPEVVDISISEDLKLCISKKLTRYSKDEIKSNVYALLAQKLIQAVGLEAEVGEDVAAFFQTMSRVALLDESALKEHRIIGNELRFQIAKITHFLSDGKNGSNFCEELSSVKSLLSSHTSLLTSEEQRVLDLPSKLISEDLNKVYYELGMLELDCASGSAENYSSNENLEKIEILKNVLFLHYRISQKIDKFTLKSQIHEVDAFDSNGYFITEFAKASYANQSLEKINSLVCEFYEDQNLLYEKKFYFYGKQLSQIRRKLDKVTGQYIVAQENLSVSSTWKEIVETSSGNSSSVIRPIGISIIREGTDGPIGVKFSLSKNKKYFKAIKVENTNADLNLENQSKYPTTIFMKTLISPEDRFEVTYQASFNPEFKEILPSTVKATCRASADSLAGNRK